MFCENCGAKLEDDAKFCTECGTPVEDIAVSEPAPQPVAQPQPVQQTAPQKSPLVPILIAVLAVLVIAIGIGAFFILRSGSDETSDEASEEIGAPEEFEDESSEFENFDEEYSDDEFTENHDDEPEDDAKHDEDQGTDDPEDSWESITDTEPVESGPVDEENSNTYIIDDSDKVILEKKNLMNMSDEELRLAINEIYARHGRKFKSSDLQEYFNSKPWYSPKYDPDEFDRKQTSILSDVELKNLETLTTIRKERGN